MFYILTVFCYLSINARNTASKQTQKSPHPLSRPTTIWNTPSIVNVPRRLASERASHTRRVTSEGKLPRVAGVGVVSSSCSRWRRWRQHSCAAYCFLAFIWMYDMYVCMYVCVYRCVCVYMFTFVCIYFK